MKRIMICDDDIFSSSILQGLLESNVDSEIIEIRERRKIVPFLEELEEKNKPVDIIFLSMEMKKKNTLDIVQFINEFYKKTRVVLCGSRNLTDENLATAINYNVKSILGKPYDYDEVISLLEKEG